MRLPVRATALEHVRWVLVGEQLQLAWLGKHGFGY
jgi:hypothetical protein